MPRILTRYRAGLQRLNVRSSDGELIGQGLRFAIAGMIVALVYTLATIILADVVGLRFQLALLAGFVTSLAAHFTLQRMFVWIHHEKFALSLHHQVIRYLLLAAVQYGITASSTALLPGALGLPTELIYLGTVAVLVSTNFVVFRHGVFHATESTGD